MRRGALALLAAALTACAGGASSSRSSGGEADAGASSPADGAGGDGTLVDGAGNDGGSSQAACTPPAGSPAPGSPIIFQAPSPVAPGQVALLFGAKVGAAAQVRGVRLGDGAPGLPPRPLDCVPTSATGLQVLQASDLSAKAVIPGSWTAGLFALVVQNASGASAPVVLNRPRIDWVHGGPGGSIVSGATVDVYGRSLGARPLAWVVDASGAATALSSPSDAGVSSDGYAASFTVPPLPAGTYALYVHSGAGGPSGFSDPFSVSVAAPVPWPTAEYPVAAGSGDDDGALAAALQLAQSGGGGVIAMATGSFTLTHGVVLPPKTVLRSATGRRGDVTITFDEAAIPFPYGFAGDGDFAVESVTVASGSSARLLQCPTGVDFMRDPESGGPQNQPDPPCHDARLHDASLTLTTLRDRVIGGVQTTTPSATIMVVMNGDDVEISDSSLINTGGSALSLAKANRLYLLRNTLVSGSTRYPATQPMPLSPAESAVGGGCGLYAVRDSAIVGNTVGPSPGLGSASTMYIEWDAHDLYIADNTIGPNLSNYGEGFSFDAPYYPSFLGVPTAVSGRTVTFPRVLNAAGHTVFHGPSSGVWPASGGPPASVDVTRLAGSGVLVVNGTGLGQDAEVVSSAATAADGSTQVTLDRDWRVPLDATSVIVIGSLKSRVVFARNTFHDVTVGAQLYAGGYDFIIDGNRGGSLEGTYCFGDDFMSARSSASDLQRRFSGCYFSQWIGNTMTAQVDATYPWAQNPPGGLFTPFTRGLVGVHLAIGADPLLPPQRGLGAVGNIVRGNGVQGFTLGLTYSGGNGPLPSPMPEVGRDNVIEHNQTQSVPVGVFVGSPFAGTLVEDDTCASGCQTAVENLSDGG